jgi:hypothetical protein
MDAAFPSVLNFDQFHYVKHRLTILGHDQYCKAVIAGRLGDSCHQKIEPPQPPLNLDEGQS